MNFYFSQFIRFALVALKYPRAGLSFFLRVLCVLPGLSRKVEYRQDKYQEKLRLKENKESIGYALGDRSVVLLVFGKRILSLMLPEGETASADQFYLNRPLKDVKLLLELVGHQVNIKANDRVFDPGCGAGRHLYFLADKYGCSATGVDVYQPAIAVASSANWKGDVTFRADSSIAPGFLDQIIPDGCDYVFINSWLNHVKDYDGYETFSVEILDKARFLLIITTTKDNLHELFHEPQILLEEIRDNTRYVLMRGNKGQG